MQLSDDVIGGTLAGPCDPVSWRNEGDDLDGLHDDDAHLYVMIYSCGILQELHESTDQRLAKDRGVPQMASGRTWMAIRLEDDTMVELIRTTQQMPRDRGN